MARWATSSAVSCTRPSSMRCGAASTTCSSRARYPEPDEGYHSVPWPMI